MNLLATFTIFGNHKMYNIGALKQLELYNKWSEEGPDDWRCIFYVGDTVPDEIKTKLLDNGAYVVHMEGYPEDQTSTFWRWVAFKTFNDIDAIFSRDVDSRLSEREKLAVNEFLASKANFHVIRDHPFHGVPILAGLFGAKQQIFRLLADLIPVVPPGGFFREVNQFWRLPGKWGSNDSYQVDQMWLRLKVYPEIRFQLLAHDSYFGFDRKRYKSILPERDKGDFVGKGFDENDEARFPEHDELLEIWPVRVGR